MLTPCTAAVWLAVAIAQDQPDPRQRVRTARELARQGSAAIPALRTLIKDPELEVRLEAVKSVVAIGTQHSLDPLVEATRDADPEIQIRATDGLVNFYLPGYVQTGLGATLRRAGGGIVARFTDSNDQIVDPFVQARADVIEALGKLARGATTMEARANAARAAGVLRGRQAVPDLITALRSKDSRILYEALVALRKIREPSTGPEIAFLLRDLDERVQLAAIETTGVLVNREALPRLREILQRSENTRVRRATLSAIARMPDPASRPLYRTYLTNRDDELRAAAAEGFARLQSSGDIPMLEKAFKDEGRMNPRLSLAFALVMNGQTEIAEFSPLQYLINQLNSRLWRGVSHAFLVESSRIPAVRSALLPVLRSSSKSEVTMVAQVLASSGDTAAIPHLEPLTRHPDPEIAQEALRALRTLRARQ